MTGERLNLYLRPTTNLVSLLILLSGSTSAKPTPSEMRMAWRRLLTLCEQYLETKPDPDSGDNTNSVEKTDRKIIIPHSKYPILFRYLKQLPARSRNHVFYDLAKSVERKIRWHDNHSFYNLDMEPSSFSVRDKSNVSLNDTTKTDNLPDNQEITSKDSLPELTEGDEDDAFIPIDEIENAESDEFKSLFDW